MKYCGPHTASKKPAKEARILFFRYVVLDICMNIRCSIYGVVVTSQNGGDKAQCIAMWGVPDLRILPAPQDDVGDQPCRLGSGH